MDGWLTGQGAFELGGISSAREITCAQNEMRLIIAPEGSCEVVFDDGAVTLAGDKVLLLRGAAPIAVRPSADARLCQISIKPGAARAGVMSPADMYAVYADYRGFCALDARHFLFHDKQAHVISASTLIASYQQYDACERELLTGCALCTLLLCAAAACVRPSESAPPGNRHVRAAIQFMRDNYMFDITTEDIARAAGVHVGHLHRLFAEQTGSHPGQYLNSLRMEKARFLLARTDLSMLSISKLCGITTQQYFSRCFKRCSGVTPQEYRRTYAVTCDYRSMRTADTIDFREV